MGTINDDSNFLKQQYINIGIIDVILIFIIFMTFWLHGKSAMYIKFKKVLDLKNIDTFK